MMIPKFHVGPVRRQMNNTQNTNNSEIITQKIPNSRVCSMQDGKSKRTKADKSKLNVCSTDKSESKSVIVNESSTEESGSEIVHQSINTNKEKYTIDETEHDEPLVTDNLVINDMSYLNLFECNREIFYMIDAM